MASFLRLLVALVIVGALAGCMFFAVRLVAARSRRLRAISILLCAGAVVLGLLASVWLPRRIPETSGSPASLVLIALLWLSGGGLAFLGAAGFFGALFARPLSRNPKPDNPRPSPLPIDE